MLQIHSNARTTPAARSDPPSCARAWRYGVGAGTIRKWRKRGIAS